MDLQNSTFLVRYSTFCDVDRQDTCLINTYGLQPQHVAMQNKCCPANQLRVRAEARTHVFLTGPACSPRDSVSLSRQFRVFTIDKC